MEENGLKFTEFKNGLNNGDTFSTYLFEGEDAYFRNRGLNLIKDKFFKRVARLFVQYHQNTIYWWVI